MAALLKYTLFFYSLFFIFFWFSLLTNPKKAAFMSEVKMLYGLQHENIGKIIGGCHSLDEESYFILMEKIGGGSINSKIQSGLLSLDEITRYALGTARALAHLHEKSPPILHRDIKPDNILIDEEDNIKLIDFGIAKVFLFFSLFFNFI